MIATIFVQDLEDRPKISTADYVLEVRKAFLIGLIVDGKRYVSFYYKGLDVDDVFDAMILFMEDEIEKAFKTIGVDPLTISSFEFASEPASLIWS
jgi:hypothetical protein